MTMMEHLWIYLSLICAFSLATSDALLKKRLNKENELMFAWLRYFFSLPVLFITLYFSSHSIAFGDMLKNEIPIENFLSVSELDKEFYMAFFLALPLEILAIILYTKALRHSPLSLTLPFLSLTPVFLILFSYLIVGEKVSYKGALGIFLIASGSYTLNLGKIKRNLFEPFKSIFREKGSMMMIAVAFIYSFTSSLGKVAIEHSSPIFFGATYFTAVILCFTPVAIILSKGMKRVLNQKNIIHTIVPGIFYGIMIITHMIAISIAYVAYMISIKRLSLLIGVLYGYLIFKEKGIVERLTGAFLMFVGFVLIVTSK